MTTDDPRIIILGSCSGTEPIPGRHHTAWILACGGDRLYQFDAGENCSYHAHTMELDLTKLHGLFISHPHSDHLAGYPALLCVVNKIRKRYRREPAVLPIPAFTPEPAQLEAALPFLMEPGTEELVAPHRIAAEGEIFADDLIRVEARHNRHLGIPDDGVWKSFSFRITVAGRRIVYSGDVKGVDELGDWLAECDLLMMESGHHHPWEVAAALRGDPARQVKRLLFLHHGRDYLDRPGETAAKTAEAWGTPVDFAYDGMIVTPELRSAPLPKSFLRLPPPPPQPRPDSGTR